MEFLNYRTIKARLKKRGLLFKKPSLEDASSQFYLLARQLDDHKLYSGFCYLAVRNCLGRTSQVGAFLNAARAFSQANYEVISLEDHVRDVIWVYSQALLICDNSFKRPIYLEMGRFHESHKMYQQAADCFNQSMSITRCVDNLILSKCYKKALNELKKCPPHLLTTKDIISLSLLEIYLNDDATSETQFQGLLLDLSSNSATNDSYGTSNGPLPVDDCLFDLYGLLDSLLLFKQDKRNTSAHYTKKDMQIKEAITDQLSAYLNHSQIQLLYLITSSKQTVVDINAFT